MARTESWKKLREQRALNGQHVEAYERLMEVEARLLAMRSIRHEDITPGEALPQPDMSIVEPQQDICLSSLMRYVTALGGQLEVRAVFPDETVTLVGADQAVG